MAEYIEREELLYEFREIMPDIGVNELADELYNVALDLPAADVKEVQHGKWEYIGTDKKGYVYQCSNCAGRIGLDYETNYCPNCGANMDLED